MVQTLTATRPSPSTVARVFHTLEAEFMTWKTLRTTNVIDRLFNEVKRRSHKMAAAFRNEGSCLRMFFAIVRSLKFRRINQAR